MIIYKKLILPAAIVTLLIIITLLGLIRSTQEKLYPADFDSYWPYGLKAVASLLAQEGYKLQPVNSFNQLADSRQLLLVSSDSMEKGERAKLLKWVKHGGTLLELATGKPQLNPGNLRLEPILNPFKTATITSTNELSLHYKPKRRFLWVAKQPETGLYGYREGFFAFAQVYGNGKLLTWTDPDGLSNLWLKQYQDNAVCFGLLARSLLIPGQLGVYYPTDPNRDALGHSFNCWDFFDRYWVGAFLICCCMGLALWKVSARWGRPRPLVLQRGRSSNEFLTSLAHLFQLADTRSMVIENFWKALLKTSLSLTGLTSGCDVLMIKTRLEQITGHDYQQLIVLDQAVTDTALNKISKKDFLKLAARIDQLRKELIAWKEAPKFINK